MAFLKTGGGGERPPAWARMVAVCAAIALMPTASAAGSGPSPGGLEGPEPVLSPLEISVLTPPQPVLGADGRNHLVYELRLSNLDPADTVVDALQPLAGGRPLGARLTGRRLSSAFRLDNFQRGTTTLAPGMGATILMDVTFPANRRPPRSIAHRIWLTYGDPRKGKLERVSFTGAAADVVQSRAIEIASPLRGPRWVAASVSDHRAALNVIDGRIYVAERFAFDFVQLDPQGRLFTGPRTRLSSYPCFGLPIHAVANGTVVGLQDGLRDQTPGTPTGITLQNAGGNYVVERIGPGRFAFYAHLRPGSLRVRRGQRLRTGQVIGLLGNSGNSDGPHLHFHLMDSASPLKSNGIPYTFRVFRGMGVVTSMDPIFRGEPAPIDRRALAGLHRGQLPLGDELVDFG